MLFLWWLQDELSELWRFGGSTRPISSGQIEVEKPALVAQQYVVVLLVDATVVKDGDTHGHVAKAVVPIHLRSGTGIGSHIRHMHEHEHSTPEAFRRTEVCSLDHTSLSIAPHVATRYQQPQFGDSMKQVELPPPEAFVLCQPSQSEQGASRADVARAVVASDVHAQQVSPPPLKTLFVFLAPLSPALRTATHNCPQQPMAPPPPLCKP